MQRARKVVLVLSVLAMASFGSVGVSAAQDTVGGCQHCHTHKDLPLPAPRPQPEPETRTPPTDEERTGGQGGEPADPTCDPRTETCPTT